MALAPLQHEAKVGWECPAGVPGCSGMVGAECLGCQLCPHPDLCLPPDCGFWAPWSCKSSASFPLFHPVHAPIAAFLKDLLLPGPFGSTLGLYLLFLLCWGHQGLSPAHQVWPSSAANSRRGSESSQGCGGHEEMAAEHGAARGPRLFQRLESAPCGTLNCSLQRWTSPCAPSPRRFLPPR